MNLTNPFRPINPLKKEERRIKERVDMLVSDPFWRHRDADVLIVGIELFKEWLEEEEFDANEHYLLYCLAEGLNELHYR